MDSTIFKTATPGLLPTSEGEEILKLEVIVKRINSAVELFHQRKYPGAVKELQHGIIELYHIAESWEKFGKEQACIN